MARSCGIVSSISPMAHVRARYRLQAPWSTSHREARKTQPAAYMKICALLVPKEMKVEHAGGLKALADELRTGHQSQDRQSAGSGSTADAGRPRRRGDGARSAFVQSRSTRPS